MQWTNDKNYQNEAQTTDVYSDVKTPYSTTFFGTEQNADTQEFSLEEIQKKLGVFKQTEIEDNAAVKVAVKTDEKPSEQTLKMSYDRDYSEDGAAVKSRFSTKTKVAVASYAIVVLALIIAVTWCGVLVTGSFGTTAALYSEYADASSVVADLSAQVNTEDYAALAEKAAELGYIDASRSNTQTYTEIETRPAQNLHVESNWFDSLCDWLSGAFGG